MSTGLRSSSTPGHRFVLTVLVAQALVHTDVPFATPQQLTEARVTHVADGDSLVVLVNGRQERLRLIGGRVEPKARGHSLMPPKTAACKDRALANLVQNRAVRMAAAPRP